MKLILTEIIGSLNDYLAIFKHELRYQILVNFPENEGITSDDVIKILNEKDIECTKPTVFRHLTALEKSGILEHQWDISSHSPPKAIKKFKVKEDKKDFIRTIKNINK